MADNEEKIEEPVENTENTGAEESKDSELHSILYGGEYSEYGDDLGAEEEAPEPKRRLKTFADSGKEEAAEKSDKKSSEKKD